MNLKKKENIVIIAILVVMLIAIIGVSWAAFNFSKAGNTPNKITTGSIIMTYTESDNTISLDNALPTTDATGTTRLKDGEYFDFTVSSEIVGDVNINYEISAKEVGDGTIDGSNIKLYLTELVDGEEQPLMSPEVYNEEASSNSYTGRPAGEMSLYTSSMNASEEHTFRLRMYVTEEYNPQGDGGGLTFTVQVNVYGKAGDKPRGVGEVIIENLTSGDTFDDGVDTFITGEDPNNYIWYSGKLWRAVSVNNEAKTTKLVTQWDIGAIAYDDDSSAFDGSHMEEWLNDTTVDGFLGNLREPEKFIIMDAVWDATEENRELGSITRPNGTTTVIDPVGLLNIYEYQMASEGYIDGIGTDYIVSNAYINNELFWWTLTPVSSSTAYSVYFDGWTYGDDINFGYGIRPSINLKSNILISSGDGTANNPYRLEGDNDANLSGTLLKNRYSGEYVHFGIGENNLYRIISHENGIGTKIASDEPLKDSGKYKEVLFDDDGDLNFSTATIGEFLNGEYLTNYVGNEYINMIEDNTTWYLGAVGGGTSYKLAKYTDKTGNTLTSSTADCKVGLLRYGELLPARDYINSAYWLLTKESDTKIQRFFPYDGTIASRFPSNSGMGGDDITPALNLKSNVVITSGDGTKNNPFNIELQ